MHLRMRRVSPGSCGARYYGAKAPRPGSASACRPQCRSHGCGHQHATVKTTEAGGLRGYDAGKKINGRKRHVLVEIDRRTLESQVHPASVQDRDRVPEVLQAAHARFPSSQKVFADSFYAAERVANATSIVISGASASRRLGRYPTTACGRSRSGSCGSNNREVLRRGRLGCVT
jgi:Transposase DDE domain